MKKKISVYDLKKEWNEKQKFNIKAFNNLERKNLSFESKIQRKLLLKKFDSGETLYIIYPGKESSTNAKRKRIHYNDFYPELVLNDNKEMETKTFANVWDDIQFLYDSSDASLKIARSIALATLLIRMAYMYDSKKVKNIYSYVDFENNNVINSGELELEYYSYLPNEELFEELGISTDLTIRGCKLIPYLTYNDLIAQNEDCKYISVMNKNASNTGRRNTFLTYVSVIAYLEGQIKLSELLQQFQRGVAPIKLEKFAEVTNNRIYKK